MRRLPPEDLAVITDHYIIGRRRRGVERKRAMQTLLALLEDVDP